MAGVEVKVEIPGLDKLVAALKKYPSIAAPILDKAIKKSIYDVQAKTIPLTPIKTGRLRGSFQVGFSALAAVLKPSVTYALFVHEGTAPHVIRPVSAKALYWRGADHPVKSVNHPGTRANRFMVSGLAAAQTQVIQNFSHALDEVNRKIASQV